ncbi:chromosomal replication initiator protein DnaA [Helicobacter saguini]|uniref:Chromosomal replication initiator protein DnaA n=1 Tax=Helicobacter saguini TaxID=1548018 RepID=A0A347VQX9_9HELI|nr:chromosomal replication initiator protein DnaA [Helicobacter saguini]MWV63116.1 chromosomal replication initiator protein DnaA [Helicobacter saguini]MWV66214.1 chromosomal replication initiator protein DnaA [Helicobacter saguini]MWV68564.1 chromosomal replication initiator protein DnaA [Helicobacter saguini]MWV71882.1 chromosomal replication initiator protein DnaA [Helicobacter saguini]TLD95897.1 chromosomal replication initiator protein DnaA [Helicobacter saguini]
MNGNDVLEILRENSSMLEKTQYLDKIAYDYNKSSESKFIFIAKNSFILNWVKRKYESKMLEIAQNAHITPKIIFILESQLNIETIDDVKTRYYIKNNTAMTNTECSFENFIVGECNAFAYESAKSVVDSKARYNPLLIHGSTGLGKTHLLHSICNAVYKKNPNASVIYIEAETMFNEYKHRITNKSMDQFRERFRKCDYLLIDDVQFLGVSEKFQEEFFNTFNNIVQEGGQIVMTSDKPPKKIEKLETRLKSRFMGGMMAKIESPELETRINIIKQKCRVRNIQLDSEVIEFIAVKIQENIRDLEGTITTIYGNMMLLKVPITIELLKTILEDRSTQSHEINLNDIINLMALEYNIKPSEIKSKTRGKKNVAKARKIVAYLAKNVTRTSFPDIAMELNLKGHSAVSKQIKTISDEIQKDSKLKMEIENLKNKLMQKN